MIETLLAAPVVTTVILGGSILMYRWFAEVWMTRAAREAAVCLTSPMSASRCRSRLESTLKAGLPFGRAEIEELRLQKRNSIVRLSLGLLPVRGAKVEIETEVSFPRFD